MARSKGARSEGSARGFSEEERAAMRDALRERTARSRPGGGDAEREVLEKIAAMGPSDRAIASRLHTIVRTHAPTLVPRTWYGMPAYSRDGEVLCFFRPAGKFKTRYATLGFSDVARLDEGRMWPTDFALTELTAAEEATIVALLQKATR